MTHEESAPRAEGAPNRSGGPAESVAGIADNSQLQLAFADRQAGVEASLAAAESVLRDDRARVEEVIATLARTGEPWTADHVHEALAGTEYNRNVVSSAMSYWSRQGWIVTDWTIVPTPSSHRPRHGSRNRWWRGNLANPREDSRNLANFRESSGEVGDGGLGRHGDAAVERHAGVDRDDDESSTRFAVDDFQSSPVDVSGRTPVGLRPESPGDTGVDQ